VLSRRRIVLACALVLAQGSTWERLSRRLGFVMLTNVAVSDLLHEGTGIVWRHLAGEERPVPAPLVPAP
jgi:hypothetical protein